MFVYVKMTNNLKEYHKIILPNLYEKWIIILFKKWKMIIYWRQASNISQGLLTHLLFLSILFNLLFSFVLFNYFNQNLLNTGLVSNSEENACCMSFTRIKISTFTLRHWKQLNNWKDILNCEKEIVNHDVHEQILIFLGFINDACN